MYGLSLWVLHKIYTSPTTWEHQFKRKHYDHAIYTFMIKFVGYSYSKLYASVIIIWFEARLQPNIGFTLRCILAVFTRSAITLLKVSQLG